MYSITINLLSNAGRKFLLRVVGSLWILIFGIYEATWATGTESEIKFYQPKHHRQLVQEWLYNYSEIPDNADIEKKVMKLTSQINKFQRMKERYKSEEQWLENIFYQVHRKFLIHYEKFSTVPELFEQGTYNCVSGTALYALVCELLYIPYAIRETEYHVYLLALVDGKKVLIESTDPLNGFVNEPSIIQNMIKAYHEEGASENVMPWPLNSTVDWIELVGLQYFNEAVQLYNKKNFQHALDYLDKAMQYYKSSRIMSFKEHILRLTLSYPKNT